MEYICFYQSQRNLIWFITSLNHNRDFMEYYKFFEFINKEFKIKDFFEFKTNVDKFKTIILYSDNTWEIIKEEVEEATFQELYDINKDDQEKQKTIFEKQVESSKLRLNQIFDFRKKDILKLKR
jgi:hypothetical protein